VEEGEVVLLYEKDNRSRDLLLYGLTKNLPMFNEIAFYKSRSSTIRLGGIDIRQATRKNWHEQIGVIMSTNFYFIGTLKENISWGLEEFNYIKARHLA